MTIVATDSEMISLLSDLHAVKISVYIVLLHSIYVFEFSYLRNLITAQAKSIH
jgi:hypothetical protein